MSKDKTPSQPVPQLRFPEFRDAAPWVPTSLAKAFRTITNGKANAQDHDEDGKYPLFDRSETIKRSPAYMFDADAVILPGEGAHFTPRRFSGKFNLHQRAYALMDCSEDIDFTYYALDEGKGRLANKAVQSTVRSLRMPIIEKFTIACPDPAEQRKIAECLGSLDDWIAAETEALETLRRHKTGLMQQLFPRPGETRPRLRFPEFKDGPAWDTPAMSDIYGFRPTNSLSRDQLNYDEGMIYNIHYGDIHTKFQSQFRIENERVPRVLPAIAEELGDRLHLCQEGDIILADASEDLNDVGKAIELISLGGQRVVSGTHTIHATRLGDKPTLGFGGYLFQSAAVRRGIQKEAQGAKVYGISPTRIASVPLPMPPTTNEQSKIAECLGSLDAQILAQSETLAGLREHKRGLMQQLFPAPDTAEGGG
ncbi:MAG: restriction endonuclease subunit S [Phycisphaerales bacterium]